MDWRVVLHEYHVWLYHKRKLLFKHSLIAVFSDFLLS